MKQIVSKRQKKHIEREQNSISINVWTKNIPRITFDSWQNVQIILLQKKEMS